jgi:glycosyltransferase involved in cell wall biosynthesis
MGNPWWIRDNPLAWWVLWRKYRSYSVALPAIKRWAVIGSGLGQLLLMHRVPMDRIALLPNPVDTKSLQALALPKPRKILRVGYIGALTSFKGVQVLADAVEGLPVELHIAGEGPLAAMLQHRNNVVLHGRVIDLPAFYKTVDVVVVPSIWPEGFGRVAVEAMAAGRPVIASDNGGLRDIIKGCKGGVLVPAGDVAALRQEIMTLAKKPRLCAQRGKACRVWVDGKYDPDVIGRRFAGFFKTLL